MKTIIYPFLAKARGVPQLDDYGFSNIRAPVLLSPPFIADGLNIQVPIPAHVFYKFPPFSKSPSGHQVNSSRSAGAFMASKNQRQRPVDWRGRREERGAFSESHRKSGAGRSPEGAERVRGGHGKGTERVREGHGEGTERVRGWRERAHHPRRPSQAAKPHAGAISETPPRPPRTAGAGLASWMAKNGRMARQCWRWRDIRRRGRARPDHATPAASRQPRRGSCATPRQTTPRNAPPRSWSVATPDASASMDAHDKKSLRACAVVIRKMNASG